MWFLQLYVLRSGKAFLTAVPDLSVQQHYLIEAPKMYIIQPLYFEQTEQFIGFKCRKDLTEKSFYSSNELC